MNPARIGLLNRRTSHWPKSQKKPPPHRPLSTDTNTDRSDKNKLNQSHKKSYYINRAIFVCIYSIYIIGFLKTDLTILLKIGIVIKSDELWSCINEIKEGV